MVDPKIIEDLEIFTKKIMEDEGISEYELNIEGQTGKGINYCSEIVFFNVTLKKSHKKYNFVMKTARRSEAMRKGSEDSVADKREMLMYSQVFPALRQFLAESQSFYQLENVPKVFFVCTDHLHETAIMEDLRAQGYKLWDTQKAMDLEHIETVLCYYGKYHAASIALRAKKTRLFQDITKDMDCVFSQFNKNRSVRELYAGYAQDALDILKENSLVDIAEKLRNLPKEKINTLSTLPEVEDRVVITHGDCWSNNMMFKYQDSQTKKPSGVCFLDFQSSLFGSPATDLSYFLYATLDADLITYKLDQLLVFYYDSLVSTMKNLGLKTEEMFTFEQLMKHWKKYAIFGLIMASVVIKIQLMKKEDTPDFANSEDGFNWAALRIGKIENDEAYRKRIVAVYKHYAKTCLD